MRLRLLTAATLFLTAADVNAGPILDRLRARVHRPACASGQCQPATAFRPAAPVAASPAVTYTVGGCPGGVCPAPVRVGR